MRPRRAFCISRDPGVRGAVGRVLEEVGLVVEHRDALPPAPDIGEDVAAIVVDRATREASGSALAMLRTPVVIVGDDLDDDGLITLMLDGPVSHHVSDPQARELSITTQKLVTGDVFGLEKYLAAGSPVSEHVLRSLAERWLAIDEVCAWAEGIGARRPVVHRLRSVADELLMNALREARGGEACAVLRWATDGATLAVSVGDGYGALRQRDVVAHVRRARHEGGRPRVSASGGAGLGLYLVLANVASLIVNIAPGEKTEVVCLFDLVAPRRRRAVSSSVRSLHVFAASSGAA